MKEMLRKVNPGLARRFPLENAFYFEDYNDEQLLAILDHKLKTQGLEATQDSKAAAINVLSKIRRRRNFGNAGEVENLLSRAKDRYSRRQKVQTENCDGEVIFEPQDFDPDITRTRNALVDCKFLFKDVVGSDPLVEKLSGYIQSFINAKEMDMEASEVLPFNFVFKGPPGTGKTTTARKIATDLVASYVGQTGPKVVAKFDEALGQVLFIDEAYRLGEGQYAKEAIDEIVDCLTKEKYKGKMLTVIAGYEAEINQLLTVNPGLSSRFSEGVIFGNLSPSSEVVTTHSNSELTQ